MNYYNPETILYLNGDFVKASEACADFYSASFHYGYAVFEGIRAYKTKGDTVLIFKPEAHFDRLKASAQAVGIPYPYDNGELINATYKVLAKNRLQDAYIRPLVFCPPMMSLQHAASSSIMIAAWEWGKYLGDKLLRVMTSSFQRPNPGAFKVQAKVSGHYVNSIMATQEAKDKGFDEALLLDMDGNVAEGPGANVFYEKNGVLYTPPLGNILPGITRGTVLELAEELQIPVVQKHFTVAELKMADAAFFCGTAAEVIGWQSLDNTVFLMPWTESLSSVIQQAYKAKVLNMKFTPTLTPA